MKRSISRKGQLGLAAAAAVGLFGPSAVRAANYTWTGTSGTTYSDPGNWTPVGGPPVSGDQAIIASGTSPNPSDITLTGAATAGAVRATVPLANFNLSSQSLTVDGTGGNSSVNNDGELKFTGAGTVNFSGTARMLISNGYNKAGTLSLESGAVMNWSRNDYIQMGNQSSAATLNIKSGSQLNTTAGHVSIGDYALSGQATVNIDGANSNWTNNGAGILMPRSGAATSSTVVNITNGGAWIESTPYAGPSITLGDYNGVHSETININGAGSKYQSTTNTKINLQNGVKINVTNGGLLDLSAGGGSGGRRGDSFRNNGTTTQILVDGVGSKLDAGQQWTIGGRNAGDARGFSVNTISNGAELVATGYNVGAVVVLDKGTLKLDNGTVRVGDGSATARGLYLNNIVGAGYAALTTADKATLTGTGTIIRSATNAATSYRALEALPGTRITPGGSGAFGTITVQGGRVRTAAQVLLAGGGPDPEKTQTELNWELSTAAGNPHDLLQSTNATASVIINGTITYIDAGIAAGGGGIMDFIRGATITYLPAGAGFVTGDIPLNTDNLDTLMSAKGYTCVFGTPVLPTDYRYSIVNDVLTADDGASVTLDALRLEMAPVPEPGTFGLLAAGGLLMLRRRRRSN